MSSLIVKVRTIDDVLPHPNADRLEIIKLGGWQCVHAKGAWKKGDKCVYLPPDSVLPEDIAEKYGLTNYTSPLPKNVSGDRPPGRRIRAIRLRSEQAFGTVIPCTSLWEIGKDVMEVLGITKYEPPEPCRDGDAERPDPAFHRYTDIENIRNFYEIFKDGEEVVMTEKIHGTSQRTGLIRTSDESGNQTFAYMCGSHKVRRKEYDANGVRSQYWLPLVDNVKTMLNDLCKNEHNVIMFCEIFGIGVQDLTYGQEGRSFRAFDLAIDGKYLDFPHKEEIFKTYNIPTVNIIYRSPFSWDALEEYSTGDTTMCDINSIKTNFKGREGIVIHPITERFDKELGGDGRVVLKSINIDYLARKDGTEFH